jgi:hypothetical protein
MVCIPVHCSLALAHITERYWRGTAAHNYCYKAHRNQAAAHTNATSTRSNDSSSIGSTSTVIVVSTYFMCSSILAVFLASIASLLSGSGLLCDAPLPALSTGPCGTVSFLSTLLLRPAQHNTAHSTHSTYRERNDSMRCE